ncbi:MAG: rare lipoprotein [Candidatus Peribacteria bacterium]|nr:rare lipoprotein [Candidatus Peribacteria bacterium]
MISLFFVPQILFAADASVHRVDGFLQIWSGMKRPALATKTTFTDVPKDAKGFTELSYAKKRGILDNVDTFSPAGPLTLGEAVLWLLRTRNADDIDLLTVENISKYLEKYPMTNVLSKSFDFGRTITSAELTTLINTFDDELRDEVHEVSNYGEKFQGKGTAFGEIFDMNAMTAAHRTFPQNTIVKVTNVANGKSVTVRINDRGPFVEGRDMDLSKAAFYSIADKSGVMNARFERLGDASIVAPELLPQSPQSAEPVACTLQNVFQQRVGGGVALLPGIPGEFKLGTDVTLKAKKAFVVRKIAYPDGTYQRMSDWVNPGEEYSFRPAIPGSYRFEIGGKAGRTKILSMQVKNCI